MIERLEQTPANQEAEIINKLNNVIDAHNRHSELLDQIAGKVLVEPKESAEKKEETPGMINTKLDTMFIRPDQLEKIKDEAVEAYKKRLVEKLQEYKHHQESYRYKEDKRLFLGVVFDVIVLVEETE